MQHIPPEDWPGIYLGCFLLALLLGMWLPYMAHSIYWERREEREAQKHLAAE